MGALDVYQSTADAIRGGGKSLPAAAQAGLLEEAYAVKKAVQDHATNLRHFYKSITLFSALNFVIVVILCLRSIRLEIRKEN